MSMSEHTHRDIDTSTPTLKEAAMHWQWGGHMWQAPERFDRMIAKVKADALRGAAVATDQEGIGANDGMNGGDWYPSEWAGQVEGWLTHRADRIEGEA